MTCIIGLIEDGKIHMVGDTQGTGGDDIFHRKDDKVFVKKVQNDSFLIGFCGSYRVGDLMRYTLEIPKIPVKTKDIRRYIVNYFIPALQKCLKENNCLYDSHGQSYGQTFLIGVRGHLFRIDTDFQVGESINQFNSCGSGYRYAIGAMSIISKNKNLTPKQKLNTALKTVMAFSASVGGKVSYKSIAATQISPKKQGYKKRGSVIQLIKNLKKTHLNKSF